METFNCQVGSFFLLTFVRDYFLLVVVAIIVMAPGGMAVSYFDVLGHLRGGRQKRNV
jgi:hypothetical protein